MQPYAKSVLNYLILNINKKPLIISLCLGVLDNLLKSYIRSNNFEDLVIIENVLEIDVNYNTGIAFGFLKDQTPFTFIASSVVLIWLIFQFKNTFNNKVEEYAFVLVLGGALGNLGERFVNLINGNDGKVTDFIELLFIPSFNLADTFISIGIFLLILSELIRSSDWNYF